MVDACRTVRVLGLLSKGFSSSDLAAVCQSLVANVTTLQWPVCLMSSAITALARFSEAATDSIDAAITHARVRTGCIVLR